MPEEKKPRAFVLIWSDAWLSGSHMVSMPRWRPMVSHLTVKELVKEHEEQFSAHGAVVDIIDVTDPNNIHSAFAENA